MTHDVQLNLVVIRSADIERAAAFYRLLGLDFVKHAHGSGSEHFSSKLDQATFEIYPPRGGSDSTMGTRLGFGIASLDVTVTKLQKAGARIVSLPKASPWGRRAIVDDPDGHRVELTELK